MTMPIQNSGLPTATVSQLMFPLLLLWKPCHVSSELECPWELLYADDLVTAAESLDELKMGLKNWVGSGGD